MKAGRRPAAGVAANKSPAPFLIHLCWAICLMIAVAVAPAAGAVVTLDEAGCNTLTGSATLTTGKQGAA